MCYFDGDSPAFALRFGSFFFFFVYLGKKHLLQECSKRLFSLRSGFCVGPLNEFYSVIQICYVFIRRILFCGSNILYPSQYFALSINNRENLLL